MNSQRLILLGFIFTSMFTALVLSDLFPPFVLAVGVLAAGIAITYYITLNQKRLRKIKETEVLLRFVRHIQGERFLPQVIEQLKSWALRLVKSEGRVFVSFKNTELFDNEKLPTWHGWEELNEQIKREQKSVMFNRENKDLSFKGLPQEIESFIGVPVKKRQEIAGVLYLFNEKEKGFFDKHDKALLEELALIASEVLERLCIYKERESLCLSVIISVVRAVESHTPAFVGHAERVAAVSRLIGRKLGLNEEEMQILEYTAIVHDIGQLESKGRKSATESEEDGLILSQEHPALGVQILSSPGIPKEVREGVLYHHERYDGSGFPEGLSRTEIPLISRIIAVADIYDALTRLPSEGEVLEHHSAIREIKKAMGSLFDPLVVTALEEAEEEVRALAEEIQDRE